MKLIQTKEYLLLIDEEAEIKVGDYYYHGKHDRVAKKATNNYLNHFDDMWLKKTIAYYPLQKEAKKLNLPLLPPFEEEPDIFSLMDKETQQYYIKNPEGLSHYINGYKASQQSKQFSLNDIKKAIEMAQGQFWDVDNRGFSSNTEGDWSFKYTEEEIIQSLPTQQLPVSFEPEYETVYFHGSGYYNESQLSIEEREKYSFMKENRLKIITNSEVEKQLVGSYKY